jgi:hypothetical protein
MCPHLTYTKYRLHVTKYRCNVIEVVRMCPHLTYTKYRLNVTKYRRNVIEVVRMCPHLTYVQPNPKTQKIEPPQCCTVWEVIHPEEGEPKLHMLALEGWDCRG